MTGCGETRGNLQLAVTEQCGGHAEAGPAGARPPGGLESPHPRREAHRADVPTRTQPWVNPVLPTQIMSCWGLRWVRKEGCACAGVGTVFRVWEVVPREGEQMTLPVMCGTAHGEVGCLSSGTRTGRLGSSSSCPWPPVSPKGSPGPPRQSPGPSVRPWELFIPSLSAREERGAPGRTWLSPRLPGHTCGSGFSLCEA